MSNKYIRVKNELPELLEAVNSRDTQITFTANYWRAQFEAMYYGEIKGVLDAEVINE